MAAQEEQRLKKKLRRFLDELLKVGTVKGFKHFHIYMRGREEGIICIENEPRSPHNSISDMHGSEKPLSSVPNHLVNPSNSLNSKYLPYDKKSLMLSSRTQRQLSGQDSEGVGLPPASPSECEVLSTNENSTLFLLAGYSRYNCPYAWVRSNHHRLVRLNNNQDCAQDYKDYPLKLKTTLSWNTKDVPPWDVIAELVKLCTRPAPTNPFEVDFEYFDTLALPQRVIASAAMIDFLQKVVLYDRDDKAYTAKVLEEMQLLMEHHFRDLHKMAQQQQVPAVLTQSEPARRYHQRQYSALEKGFHT